MALSVSILTAVRAVHRGPALAVTLETAAGQLTILPGHVPLMGQLEAGCVRLVGGVGEKVRTFATGPGGLAIENDHVMVMAQDASETA